MEGLGLTFPVLFDQGGVVHESYAMQTGFQGTVYPQDWIIGTDGKVAYVNSGYDNEAMAAVIEEELGL